MLMRAVKKKQRATHEEGGSRKKRPHPQSSAPASNNQQAGEGAAPPVFLPAAPLAALPIVPPTAPPIDLTADTPPEEPRAMAIHPSAEPADVGAEPAHPAATPISEEGSSASGGMPTAAEVPIEDAMTGEGRGGTSPATGATFEPSTLAYSAGWGRIEATSSWATHVQWLHG